MHQDTMLDLLVGTIWMLMSVASTYKIIPVLGVDILLPLCCTRFWFCEHQKSWNWLITYLLGVKKSCLTSHSSWGQCSQDRTLPGTHVAEWLEEQAVSGHGIQHPWHWQHHSQQTEWRINCILNVKLQVQQVAHHRLHRWAITTTKNEM